MSDERGKMEDKNQHSSRSEESAHHHHKKKSLWRRVRHSVKKTLNSHKWLIPAIALSLALVCAFVILLQKNIKGMAVQRVKAANQHNVGVGYRNITYKGREYRYNTRLTSVLYIGVDSEGVLEPNETFIAAPRADSIQLLVMDEYRKKLSILAIDRNTICTIHRYSRRGYDLGEFKDQLCLAYAYGENGEVSCANVCNAVSGILYGVPINDYVVCNRSTLPELCNVIGDITVTVPNDDLADLGYRAGDRMDINADNIELFVRNRDVNKDFSNRGRMQRQKEFINATIDKIMNLIKTDPRGSWEKIEAAEYSMYTDITRSRYMDLSETLSNVTYEGSNFYTMEGEVKAGTFWDEFYPDEEKLLEKVVELFYIPQ